VEASLLVQSSIALFTGLVAATLVPPVRRAIPRPLEVAMWAALVVACVIGLLSINNPHARELTVSAFWGVDQIITTLAGLLVAGVTGWLVENRFTIATWLTLACGADIMAVVLLRSHRKSRGWQPRVRLHEWVELPRLAPAPEPVVIPYALDALNRKLAAVMAVAGAAILTWSVNSVIWARDVWLPQQAGWFAKAAGALATRAIERMRTVGNRQPDEESAAEYPPIHVVGIHVVVSALSGGWYGPMRPISTVHSEEEGVDESQQADRLAS
jgi:hypothetical protein